MAKLNCTQTASNEQSEIQEMENDQRKLATIQNIAAQIDKDFTFLAGALSHVKDLKDPSKVSEVLGLTLDLMGDIFKTFGGMQNILNELRSEEPHRSVDVQRKVDYDTGWIRLNHAGLEETLIPIHIETLRMLMEVHHADIYPENKEPENPRFIIESMIFAEHHKRFGNENAKIQSVDDAMQYMEENVFMKKRSSIEDLDLDWQQTLDNKMADFKPKGTAPA